MCSADAALCQNSHASLFCCVVVTPSDHLSSCYVCLRCIKVHYHWLRAFPRIAAKCLQIALLHIPACSSKHPCGNLPVTATAERAGQVPALITGLDQSCHSLLDRSVCARAARCHFSRAQGKNLKYASQSMRSCAAAAQVTLRASGPVMTIQLLDGQAWSCNKLQSCQDGTCSMSMAHRFRYRLVPALHAQQCMCVAIHAFLHRTSA